MNGMNGGDELFESGLRDQQRAKELRERSKRIGKLQQKPASVSEILASGGEGRLYTSAAGVEGARGVTRPINPDAAVEATAVEMGRVFYVNEAMKEARAAAAAPVPIYAQPLDELDPRRFEDLNVFPDTESFMRFAEEHRLTPAQISKYAQVAQEQLNARAEIAEIDRAAPNWRNEIGQMTAHLKKHHGVTDAHLRTFFRNPTAQDYLAWREKWQAETYAATSARAQKSGRLSDVGDQIAAMLSDDEAGGPQQRQLAADKAATRDGLLGKLQGTVDGTMSSEHSSFAEREVSMNAAADYFDAVLGVNQPEAEVEDAEDRSVL